MITGDNLFTARAVAMKVGLINKAMALEPHCCVDGKFFEEFVGGTRKYYDEYDGRQKEEIIKKAHFKLLTAKLRIMARSDFETKSMLVNGLVEDQLVAVTGA